MGNSSCSCLTSRTFSRLNLKILNIFTHVYDKPILSHSGVSNLVLRCGDCAKKLSWNLITEDNKLN